MSDFSFGSQQIALTSWAYISALLTLALFFKFNRFWSVRNLDLLCLLLFSPGLIWITQSSARLERWQVREQQLEPAPPRQNDASVAATALEASERRPAAPAGGDGKQSAAAGAPAVAAPGPNQSGGPLDDGPPRRGPDVAEAAAAAGGPEATALRGWLRRGYIWLLGVAALFLLRLLWDPLLQRKPLLEPNLNRSGLTFLAVSLALFLFVDIVQRRPVADALLVPHEALRTHDRAAAALDDPQDQRDNHLQEFGPGLGFLHVLPVIPTFFEQTTTRAVVDEASIAIVIAKTMAILLQIAIVVGLVLIGQNHFGNYHTGIAMAVVYLLLPSTLLYTGNSWHMLPAALTLWAVVSFRLPVVAGLLIGLAAGVSYYPIFLLPLWFSFYWERGASRFAAGVVAALVVVVIALVFSVETPADFLHQLRAMFGVLLPRVEGFKRGMWSPEMGWDPWFRLPVLVGFLILSISFVFWPARKDLGTLIAYSGVLMAAVQFWLGYEGGLFIAWYLPLALVAIFRPNLDAVTATS